MTYREAVARLYSLERWGIKLGLENITRLCEHLGNPQRTFPTIHIAGTNGKGSVAALIDHILQASGLRIGRYTSPHLRDFRERIQINSRPISRSRMARFMERHWDLIYRERFSYFETATAMAFDAFAANAVDIGVIEVGLGGRFDATNILKPEVSIITHIDFDHERTLGNTLRRIAREKAGIIKGGTPVILGPLPPVAEDTIRRIAQRRNAPVFRTADILTAPAMPGREDLRRVRWSLPLPGPHQISNLGIALAAVLSLGRLQVSVSPRHMQRGIRSVRWPARFQVIVGRPALVFDVAHNPSGMRVFAESWKRVFRNRRAVTLFTTRQDKDYEAMWNALAPNVAALVGCPLPHSTGIDRLSMKGLADRYEVPFHWANSARAGFRLCKTLAGSTGICLVVGSHYLIGDVIPASALTSPPRGLSRQVVTWPDIVKALL
jgi:dihydrofolate synthase/folylpolyglutamate synthase